MHVKVADEVWITLALLHTENADREDFSMDEILKRADREALGPDAQLRPGVRTHVTQHCVASRPPNPGRYRMLTATARGRRRLYRPGDQCHRDRVNAKQTPLKSDIPDRYHHLLDWYQERQVADKAGKAEDVDLLLGLRGSGSGLWKDEPADAFVTRMRAGWDVTPEGDQ